ncbi:hypothetical protein FKP32DRAFT_859538 [Trametes sanguinea]|nr:hypothetical protein FKP32DRAFT_859538 [Trametes sanguinea]
MTQLDCQRAQDARISRGQRRRHVFDSHFSDAYQGRNLAQRYERMRSGRVSRMIDRIRYGRYSQGTWRPEGDHRAKCCRHRRR